MKKVILSVLVAGSLMATSCKKAKEAGSDAVKATEKVATEAVKKTEEVVKKTAEELKLETAVAAAKAMGIDIPSFENSNLTQNLADYAGYAKDYLAANGNVAEITKLAPKGAEILAKGQELLKSADAETVKKFSTVLTAIQAKMAPQAK